MRDDLQLFYLDMLKRGRKVKSIMINKEYNEIYIDFVHNGSSTLGVYIYFGGD